MREVRERRRLAADRRKEKMFQPVETNIEIEKVRRRATTMRGEKYIQAGEVNNSLVQDRSKKQVVVGSDVEALYPSLLDTQVAEIIFKAIMETEVGFEGVNYQEGCRYIVLNCTEQECRLGPLRRVLPKRRFVNGTRPGVTGAGPLGAEAGDQEQWKFPPVKLTKLEKRLIVATVMRIAVLTLFRTHTYSFGNKFYQQRAGGPIGLRSTCCVARLVMLWWDEELLQLMVSNNVITEEQARYMDDIRIWLWSIRMGWRWTGGRLEFCKDWRDEETSKGMTPLQKTTEVLEGMMNSICSWLKLTMETEDDFGGRLPTLDLSIWVGADNKVLFNFFEKPMASNVTIQKDSAMPENSKMATLNQELVRRMLNTSEDLAIEERILVVDNYCQKLANSGYRKEQISKVVIGGLTGYERRRNNSLLDPSNRKYRPLHESRKYNSRNRRISKMMAKQNWFKRKKNEMEESPARKKTRHFQLDGNQSTQEQEQVIRRRLWSDSSSASSSASLTSQENDPGIFDQTGDCSRRLEEEREHRRAANKQRKAKRLENLKIEKKKNMKEQPDTIGVMFIDQTMGGLLAKLLQEVEDRLARTTGYRIRMVELSGSKLCHLLPNTNPWSGQDCGREKCVTCGQGGERLIECKRRNILYESECTVCNPVDDTKEKEADMGKRQGVYVGESSRSIHERAFEHDGDYRGQKDDSHMMKHWLTSHADLDAPPAFRFRLVRSFPDALTRQISEAVRIDLRGEGVLNSRAEFSRCRLPRLVIDQDGWRRSKAEERKNLENNEKAGEQQGGVQGFGQDEEGWEEWVSNLVEDELDMANGLKKSKSVELKRKAELNTIPAKRKKLENLENWGAEGAVEDTGIMSWLVVMRTGRIKRQV